MPVRVPPEVKSTTCVQERNSSPMSERQIFGYMRNAVFWRLSGRSLFGKDPLSVADAEEGMNNKHSKILPHFIFFASS